MKAWRKHNAKLTAKIAYIEAQIEFEKRFTRYTTDDVMIKKLENQRKELKGFYLNNKTERRGPVRSRSF